MIPKYKRCEIKSCKKTLNALPCYITVSIKKKKQITSTKSIQKHKKSILTILKLNSIFCTAITTVSQTPTTNS